MPLSKEQLRKFYEEQARQRDHQKAMYMHGKRYELWWHRKRLSYIISFLYESLRDCEASTFLDVGCAEGYYIQLVSFYGNNVQCIGIDISRMNAKKAKIRNSNADFIACDAEYLPFVEKSFDVVLCSEVLEHILNPVNALSELLRVAKRNLIISFPGHTYTYKILSRVDWFRRVLDKAFWLKVGHISEISLELVKDFLEFHAKGSRIKAKQSGALPLQLYRFIPSIRIMDAIDETICHALRNIGALKNTTIQVIKISRDRGFKSDVESLNSG